MTILEWLSSSCRYSFEENTFMRIALDRGITDVNEDAMTLTQEQKDLMTADIIFTAVLLSPSSTASQSASHNNFQRTVGSETDIYQSNKISYALGIYKRYNDPNYEVLISARPKIKLLKIILFICNGIHISVLLFFNSIFHYFSFFYSIST